MTREDFEDEVYDVSSLVNFCNDHSFYDIIEDIYSEDSIVSEIKDCDSLSDINYLISSIDDFNAEYFYYNANGWYENVDDDVYSDMYDDLIEEYESEYGFDEEDEEEESDDCYENEVESSYDNGYVKIETDEFEQLLI